MAAEETVLEKYGNPVKVLGKGAYGVVSLHKVGEESYAIKKMPIIESDLLSTASTREIAIMKRMDHPNILKLNDYIVEGVFVYLVTKFMEEGTLNTVMKDYPISEIIRKRMAYQILCGMAYMHSIDILHRDIKPDNILLEWRGSEKDIDFNLKLADFGLARALTCVKETGKTALVITLWYRPPELLYGGKKYGKSSDMWSVGCVIYEILTGEVLFKGLNESNMILLITKRLGTPTEATWPGVTSYPYYNKKTSFEPKLNDIKDKLKTENKNEWFEIIKSLLELNPEKRATALGVLKNPLFDEVRDKEIESKYLNCLENLYAREIPYEFKGFEKQEDLTVAMKDATVNWVAAVSRELTDYSSDFFIALYIHYKAMDKIKLDRTKYQLYAAACLYIASVYVGDSIHPGDLEYYSKNAFTTDELNKMSITILEALDFDLVISTSYDFLMEYGRFYNKDVNNIALLLLYYVSLLDISYQERPHDLALVCIMIASAFLGEKFKHADKLKADFIKIEKACKELGVKKESDLIAAFLVNKLHKIIGVEKTPPEIIEIACKKPLIL